MAAPSDTSHPEGERETLLPCPFCGGSKLKNVTDDGPAWTKCETCEATGPTTFKYQEDGPDWNTRSTQPSRPQGEEAIGPRAVDRVTCEGCPAFKSEWWQEHLDNDETDSGTRAECTAASKYITSYWSPKGAPPTWCPAPSNQGKPSS